VTAGRVDTLAAPIQLTYTGIPVPAGLKIQYDTNMQVVTLVWNKPTTGSPVQGYEIYRKNAAYNTLPAAINSLIVTDTVYHDSTGVQDSGYTYYVAAVDTGNGGVGRMSGDVNTKITSGYIVLDSIMAMGGNGTSTVVVGKTGIIVDRTNDIINVYDSTFILINTFNLPADFGNGFGHAIDDSNRIWALNYNTGAINVYSITGILLFTVQDTGLSHPNIIQQGPDGNMFVQCTKAGINYQIRIYDRKGNYVSYFPNNNNPIMPSMITDMSFLQNGNLMILNHTDSSVIEYDSNGTIIQQVKLNSLVVRIGQMTDGTYAIEQDGNRGIINILNNTFAPIAIIGNIPGIDYNDYGRLTTGHLDRFIIRNANSILINGK
jgi:hypothetical protein